MKTYTIKPLKWEKAGNGFVAKTSFFDYDVTFDFRLYLWFGLSIERQEQYNSIAEAKRAAKKDYMGRISSCLKINRKSS